MARCTSCNYKWKIKEIMSLGFSKSGKNCPSCGQKQYLSAGTQQIFTCLRFNSPLLHQIER